MTLLELYKTDTKIADLMKQIILRRSRLSYKRDVLNNRLREVLPQYVDFSMSEL